MSKENFNLEELENKKRKLLRTLPSELQKAHADKTLEEISKIVEERKQIGYIQNPPDISKLHITEQLEVETKKMHKEEIEKKLKQGPEQL